MSFPPGVQALFLYDITTFVKVSITEVAHTLVEAIILVFLVMYLFLQNFRATLVPTIAVPVVLLGTFGIMSLLGYSINTLTMFGLVLAIGSVRGTESVCPSTATAGTLSRTNIAIL